MKVAPHLRISFQPVNKYSDSLTVEYHNPFMAAFMVERWIRHINNIARDMHDFGGTLGTSSLNPVDTV
jgi:hypothetical protein